MLILDSTGKSLRVRLGAAHTTTALQCVTSWRDVTETTFTPGSTLTSTNGTTGVELAAAPASDTQRIIDFVSIMNTDTVIQNVTVYIYASSTNYDMSTVALSPNERLEYSEGNGFSVYTSAGSMKTLSVGTQNVASSGWSTTVLGSDITNNNASANTIADITGLSFSVVSGSKYWFRFYIMWTSAATTTGARFSVSGPATPTQLAYRSDWSLSATTRTINEAVAYDIPAAASASVVNTGGNIATIEGFIQPSADGNVIARMASEVSSSAVVAKAGSIVQYLLAA